MPVQQPPSHVQRSPEDLAARLQEQLGFLRKSAIDFDAGDRSEAKRLAATLRILLHDKGSSHSLLGQLGRLGSSFLSTAIPYDPRSITTHSGLVIHTERGHLAPLEDSLWQEWLPFPQWWSQIVFVDKARAETTRAQLVLAMGEQDGGHHVDPTIDAKYNALSRENALNWYSTPGNTALPDAELAGVRQIAHEVLRTLDPDYKGPRQPVPIVVGGVMIHDADDVPPARPPRLPGRNDACPCGSGRKWKKCHGAFRN